MDQFADAALLTQEGVFISDKWQRLAEILEDFDPNLELRWIPPSNRTDPTDKSRPYAIVHAAPGKREYIVMFAGETDNPQNILAKLFEGNLNKSDPNRTIDAANAAAQAFEMKRNMEEMEERHDMMHFLLTNRSKFWVNWKTPEGEKVKLSPHRLRMDK